MKKNLHFRTAQDGKEQSLRLDGHSDLDADTLAAYMKSGEVITLKTDEGPVAVNFGNLATARVAEPGKAVFF
ncbi:hypothetical protein [Georgenia alba]|uniref:Uncharacterized protein n=1 Tax=Georgenia alba TaxID=2233858 RepID=A0ABW2Q481_9MICO